MKKEFILRWAQIQRKVAGLSGHLHNSWEPETWTPNADVYEMPSGLMVRVELAGVDFESIELRFENNSLIVSGSRNDPAHAGGENCHRFYQLELEYGHFRRTVVLPYPADGEKAKATLKNGLLEIWLPPAKKSKTKTITVEAEG